MTREGLGSKAARRPDEHYTRVNAPQLTSGATRARSRLGGIGTRWGSMTDSRLWARWSPLAAVSAGWLVLGVAGGVHADPHGDANAADARGDYQAERKILQPEAARGQAWAQNNLGNMYLFGNGVPHDDAQAFALFQKAAAQGDPGGEVNLGQMYEGGLGVAQDDNRAASLYRSAAEQNRPRAWTILKRLCDHAKASPPADCARVPPGTPSAPEFDFHGKPGVVGDLIWALFRLGVGIVVLVIALRQWRKSKARRDAANAGTPIVTGGSGATQPGAGDAPATGALPASFLRFTVIGSMAATALITAGIFLFVQSGAQDGLSPLAWAWVWGVVAIWMIIVVVRARRLRASRKPEETP